MSNPNILPSERIQLPLLPLRDVVVFPHMVIPLFVGRPKSIKALESAMEAGKSIMLVAQKTASKDEPSANDIYEIGCVANILQMLKLPDGTVKVLVEGAQRAQIHRVEDLNTHLVCDLTPVAPDTTVNPEIEAMRRAIVRDRRSGSSGRYYCSPFTLEAGTKTGSTGNVSDRAAPGAFAGATGGRARYSAGRKAHPRPRQTPNGKIAA